MGGPTREATPQEAGWVLAQLRAEQVAGRLDPAEVTVNALARDDGTAWFWVYPRDVAIGEIYTTWVVERTTAGVGTVSSFRSRRSAKGDVTVP